jgi:hypothetical protein
VNIPGFSGPTASRRLQDAVQGMLADTATVTLDEPEQRVADAAAAARSAGFTPRLPSARKDVPTLLVVGAHAVRLAVNRATLGTILKEAGFANASTPVSLDHAPLEIRTPRAIRAEYGHCPAPPPATLQGQLQGPPPPTTDNGDCVILVQGPAVTATVPPGLDMPQLVGIALELSGMSPQQAGVFQRTFDWRTALTLVMPRFMRSYDTVTVGSAPAMLLNTAGRRGPAWELIWTAGGAVYSLIGYGSAADALPLARSLQ